MDRYSILWTFFVPQWMNPPDFSDPESTTIRQIAKNVGVNIHVGLGINVDDPSAFHLAASLDTDLNMFNSLIYGHTFTTNDIALILSYYLVLISKCEQTVVSTDNEPRDVSNHLILLPSPEEVDRPVLSPLDDRPPSLSPTLLTPSLHQAVSALRAEQVYPAGGLT